MAALSVIVAGIAVGIVWVLLRKKTVSLHPMDVLSTMMILLNF